MNPRVVIGSLIIKHLCDLSDRETVQQIQENMYMQYFIGFSSFSDEEPFDPSLFVEFRKRLGAEQINAINEKILHLYMQKNEPSTPPVAKDKEEPPPPSIPMAEPLIQVIATEPLVPVTHAGKLIVDATACPQDISYPTDLNLLSDSREKSGELIDLLYLPSRHTKKPRTYREIARKAYLRTAQKKKKTKKEIRTAIRRQLCFLKRNIKNIHHLLENYETIPFDRHQYKYFLVIQTLYDQQAQMFQEKSHTVEHRIVSIHQPYVRPIVRGKMNANVEFGAKIQVSLMQGFSFLEELS
ncbi:MAG: transposase [Ferruginibacter sp.]